MTSRGSPLDKTEGGKQRRGNFVPSQRYQGAGMNEGGAEVFRSQQANVSIIGGASSSQRPEAPDQLTNASAELNVLHSRQEGNSYFPSNNSMSFLNAFLTAQADPPLPPSPPPIIDAVGNIPSQLHVNDLLNLQTHLFGGPQRQVPLSQQLRETQLSNIQDQIISATINRVRPNLSQNLQQRVFDAARNAIPSPETFTSQWEAAKLTAAVLSGASRGTRQQPLAPVPLESSFASALTNQLLQQQLQRHQLLNQNDHNAPVLAEHHQDYQATSEVSREQEQSSTRPPRTYDESNAASATLTSGVTPVTTINYVTIPCRARGLPSDHNSYNAYFQVPRNVRHGEDLICSYEKCRAQGVKFAYCVHCGIPVAKRNFRQRHGHGIKRLRKSELRRIEEDEDTATMLAEAEQSQEIEDVENTKPKSRKKEEKNDPFSSSGASMDCDEQKTATLQQGQVQKEAVVAKEAIDRYIHARENDRQDYQAVVGDATVARSNNTNRVWAMGFVSPERQHQWVELMYDRPSMASSDEMLQWLFKVLHVSDPVTVLPDTSRLKRDSAENDSGRSNNDTLMKSQPSSSDDDTESDKKESRQNRYPPEEEHHRSDEQSPSTSTSSFTNARPENRAGTGNKSSSNSSGQEKRQISEKSTEEDEDDTGKPNRKNQRKNT
ncbi:hypothetical protein IV203_034125 [Nitzschia inconspicua]|uniref:Uncharacterized protein n=1 Tax=Nitzschia inconspicua TaxID=303405 RepID=A0A9K3M5C4_9STRA|nr:hypothetical protein IV203_034125 [Nitzschia inconspicua]